MSVYIGWQMGPTAKDIWSGDVLIQGLSDTLSTQYARMRCLVRPSELLGAYSTDEPSASLTRRLLLLGCRVEKNAFGDSVVLGSELSRPVLLKPCGEALWRQVFHFALQAACAALDPLAGLVMLTLPGTLPTPTLCTLAFTSNKQRPILQLLPVTVVGLEERMPPARQAGSEEWGAAEAEEEEEEEEGGEGVGEGGAVGGGGAGAAAAAASPQVCGKVLAATDPATGERYRPIFLKLVPESTLKSLPSGVLEVSNTRTIFRAQAAFGLLSYKGQGSWATLSLRAVDLERDEDASLFLPKPYAAAPVAGFFSALVGSASASASAEAEAAAALAAAAGPPPVVSPILEHSALLAGLRDVLALLPGAQQVVEAGARSIPGSPGQ